MKNWNRRTVIRFIASTLALILALSGIGVLIDNEGVHVVYRTRTVNVATPTPVPVDPGTQLTKADVKEDATKNTNAVGVGLHEDQKDETPPGVSKEAIEAGAEKSTEIAAVNLGKPEEPAGAQNYSCPFAPVVNHSNLTHKVEGVALHFTVSDPGTLLAVRGLFNTPDFGASSTFGIELTGRCQQWVSLEQKAWAQLTANSWYWSIEIVTRDRTRAQWLAAPIIRRGILANLVADLLHKAGARPVLVDPFGCTFLPGVTDHSRLECGNTHWDVGTHFPWDVFMKQVRQHYYSGNYRSACGSGCRRNIAMRKRHASLHKAIRGSNCDPDRPRSAKCKGWVRENRRIHATAKSRKVKL
jgi:hypothetical protein